mmetsp:Transcript_20423/g.54522  ORF Transcript_20423/g.54522 Transcript_20423/m.54522 type:complete len:201 (+) Transcript_20423:303-905(+)
MQILLGASIERSVQLRSMVWFASDGNTVQLVDIHNRLSRKSPMLDRRKLWSAAEDFGIGGGLHLAWLAANGDSSAFWSHAESSAAKHKADTPAKPILQRVLWGVHYILLGLEQEQFTTLCPHLLNHEPRNEELRHTYIAKAWHPQPYSIHSGRDLSKLAAHHCITPEACRASEDLSVKALGEGCQHNITLDETEARTVDG